MKGFTETVKRNLGMKHVKYIETTFPRKLRWIGGFMMPIFPFFFVKNRGWQSRFGNSTRAETIIHELIHLRLMRTFKWPFLIFGVPILLILFLTLIKIPHFLITPLIIIALAAVLTYFEYETIETTRRYAEFYNVIGIRPKSQTNKLYRFYFFLYIIQLLVIFLIISLITAIF